MACLGLAVAFGGCGLGGDSTPRPEMQVEIVRLAGPAKGDRPAYEVEVLVPKGSTDTVLPPNKLMGALGIALEPALDTCWASATDLALEEDAVFIAELRMNGEGTARLVAPPSAPLLARCISEAFGDATGFPPYPVPGGLPLGLRFVEDAPPLPAATDEVVTGEALDAASGGDVEDAASPPAAGEAVPASGLPQD